MPDHSTEKETLLTEKQVAVAANISIATLRLWRGKGTGPRFIKLERMVRYPASDFRSWIDSRPAGGGPVA